MNKYLDIILKNRGYSKDYLESINNYSFSKLKDIDKMIHELRQIYLKKYKIVVLPDFDMDGIMSGVIGYAGLSELGFNVELYCPKPEEGYGVSVDTIKDLLSNHNSVDAIITCDTGITSYSGLNYAVEQGINVLVTDHHKQKSDGKLNVSVIVDPLRLDETYEHPQICGAFTLWQVLFRYSLVYSDVDTSEQINRLRLFAGVGTISDSMPVLYENRGLIKDSIVIAKSLYNFKSFVSNIRGHECYVKAFRGFLDVLLYFKALGKIKSDDDINEDFYGFYLAPTFNSVKRLEGDIKYAFGAFFGDTFNCMEYLTGLNTERKMLVDNTLEYLLNSHQPFAPYVYISNQGKGIAGLLATKLMAKTGLPTIVLTEFFGTYSGSGRSPVWYNFQTDVSNQGFFVAGHEHAFGIGFKSIDELSLFYDYIKNTIDIKLLSLDESDFETDVDLSINLDGKSKGEGLNIDDLLDLKDSLLSLRPFGSGFSKPLISFNFKLLKDRIAFIGSGDVKKHTKIRLENDIDVISWNSRDYVEQNFDREVSVIGDITINEFRGDVTITIIGEFNE